MKVQHLALTYDALSGQARLYRNGIQRATAHLGSFRPQTTYDLYVGGRPAGQGGPARFAGGMDEVSLYLRALSAAEVNAIFLAGSGGKCPSRQVPWILAQPESEALYSGQVGRLEARALFAESYQWWRDGLALDGETNAVLFLGNVSPSYAGSYHVVVGNSHGTTNSQTALLTVSDPPDCSPVDAGITVAWGFDENALDRAGNGSANIQGSARFATGLVRSGLVFDGEDDQVEISLSAGTDIGAGAGATIEFWMKPLRTDRAQYVIDWNKGMADNRVLGPHLWLDGQGGLLVDLVHSDGRRYGFFSPRDLLVAGQFQHVALTYDRSSGVARLYHSGVLVAQSPVGDIRLRTDMTLFLGNRPSGPPEHGRYEGMLDEVTLYDRALSAQEIASIAQSGAGGKCLATSSPRILLAPSATRVLAGRPAEFKVIVAGSTPLSYQWSFDGVELAGRTEATLTLPVTSMANEGEYSVHVTNPFGSQASTAARLTVEPPIQCVPNSGGEVSWWTLDGNLQELIGGQRELCGGVTRFTNGAVGQGLAFNGVTDVFFAAASPQTDLGSSSDWSITFWVNPGSVTTPQPMLEWNVGNGHGVRLWHSFATPGDLHASFPSAPSYGGHYFVTPGGIMSTGTFQHLALTFDGTSGNARLYRNGQLVRVEGVGLWRQLTGTTLYFGGSPTAPHFTGVLDEIILYKRQLTDAEILTMSSAGPGGQCLPPLVPLITLQPMTQRVPRHQTARWTVGAARAGSYQWFRNGAPLPGETRPDLVRERVDVSQAGEYTVVLANPVGAVTSVVARLDVLLQPENDDFAHAYELTGGNGSFIGTNALATSEPGEPSPGKTIWSRWIAPEHGDFHFNTANSMNMTVTAAVYIGTSVSNLTTIRPAVLSSSQSPNGSYLPDLPFRAVAGNTYYLQLVGAGPQAEGRIGGSFAFVPQPNIPVNDFFAGRLPLTGFSNSVTGNLSLASMEPGEAGAPSCQRKGYSLWWSYTAPQRGLIEISITSTSRMAWAIYRGTILETLERVAESCGAPMLLDMAAGETFQISVDTSDYGAGVFELHTRLILPPANDDFANSILLSGPGFEVGGEMVAATVESGEPGFGALARTVWYSWVAPSRGQASAHSRQGVDVLVGNSLEELQPVPGSVDRWPTVAGALYHFRINSSGGTYNLGLTTTPYVPAPNDDFADAVIVGGRFFGGEYWMNDATAEANEPAHLGTNAGQSVWWRWQAPNHGTVAIYQSGSTALGVVLALYAGTTLETLTLSATGTNRLEANVRGGELYHLAAAVPAGNGGTVNIGGGLVPAYYSHPVVGNLLLEPSFENTGLNFHAWKVAADTFIAGAVNELGGADGVTWGSVTTNGTDLALWQNFPTAAGRIYDVHFAYGSPGSQLQIYWNGGLLGVVQVPPGETWWHWTNFVAVATGSTTRLGIKALTPNISIDAFSVVATDEPVSLVSPPASVRSSVGGTATFTPEVKGSEPLRYQWFFNDTLLPGATQPALVLTSLQETHAGDYTVVVSNSYGSITTPPAQLFVSAPAGPEILFHPAGDEVAPGAYFRFAPVVFGATPLHYQWFRNGSELFGATNRTLIFNPIATLDFGTYTLNVGNALGTTWSLPASLTLRQGGPGGTVRVGNRLGGTGSAPIFDADGVTRLVGDAFLLQVYAGPSLEELRAIGGTSTFLPLFAAGFFNDRVVNVPTVPPGSTAQVQVRVWEAAKGASYEEARVSGGKHGKSDVFSIVTCAIPCLPSATMINSFRLRAGLPKLAVGVIQYKAQLPNGDIVWSLQGELDSRYLIEKAGSDFAWQPLAIIRNTSDSTIFTDTPWPAPSGTFYRARIMD